MKPTKLEWEDVIQFEEIEGYGKSIWKNEDKYYLVLERTVPHAHPAPHLCTTE